MPKHPQPFFRKARNAWYVQLGKRQVPLGPDKKAAFAEYYRLMSEQGAGPMPVANASVAELCDLFQDQLARTTRPATQAWYRNFLQGFINAHGRKRADEIRPYHVTTWLDGEPGWSPTTRRGAITAVKRCFAWAKEQGRLEVNTLVGIRRPAMTRRKVMTDEGAETFFAAIPPGPMLDFATGLMETGCRPGELRSLEASRVDLVKSLMVVCGKTGERTVMLTGRAKELLTRLLEKNPAGAVFRNTKGQPWSNNTLRCAFRRVRKKTGIAGAVPYAFRHLFGSKAIERGVDSLVVAELMGHKDVSMLQEHYVHHRAESLRLAAEKATGATGNDAKPT